METRTGRRYGMAAVLTRLLNSLALMGARGQLTITFMLPRGVEYAVDALAIKFAG